MFPLKERENQQIALINAGVDSRHIFEDKASGAHLIAEYASKNELRAYKPKDPTLKELRSLYRCLQNLKEQHTQVGNFLETKDCLPKSVEKVYQKLIKHIEKQIDTVNITID
ncbi:MAG: hypothetical protein BGO76_08550 [Caedibacter sp. 38-128]|nr:hypothetical protein [Holosporales bacterium]OJX08104.1 MAG: hypothetical protein BGO76_08550 [Caedibacter sp. 38-128]